MLKTQEYYLCRDGADHMQGIIGEIKGNGAFILQREHDVQEILIIFAVIVNKYLR
jgi:ribose 5-phosphate isomerase